jgi:spore maturation protein SpmA
MLNYIWLALIVLGIGAALTTDIVNQSENKYRNGDPLPVQIVFEKPYQQNVTHSYEAKILVKASVFNRFYGTKIKSDFFENAKVIVNAAKHKVLLYFKINKSTPKFWHYMASVTGKKNDFTGVVSSLKFKNQTTAQASIVLERISFVKMKEVTNSVIDYAGIAVKIALGLIGIMALWIGIMKIAEEAGLIKIIAKVVKPITKFLFPDVPQDHPAMGSMIMNISANMLGLGNAATPFGLKAMEELESLNPEKGTATNAMVTFLAINTAGLTLIPATAIAIRATLGSSDPTIIIGTSIFGASCATAVGIASAKILEKFPMKISDIIKWFKTNLKKIGLFLLIVAAAVVIFISGLFSGLSVIFKFINPELFKSIIQVISILAIPGIILAFVIYGFVKKVNVYASFVDGAKEGFDIAVKIIPYLVGMLVAIGIFRAGGMMEVLTNFLAYPAKLIGMPPQALPMALIRPLSGSGSTGVMTEIMSVYGPDSLIGVLVSTLYGSTETTFYVLAVYFGAVNIKKTRHAVPVGLLADFAGILGATFIVNLLFSI